MKFNSPLLNEAEFNQVLAVLEQAAAEVMEIYRSGDFTVERKADNSPVTHADTASDRVITAGLGELERAYAVVSEEGAAVQTGQTYWLLDPLDGTTDFMKRNDQFAIMLALMHNEQPVLGIVMAPALGELYVGGAVVGGAFEQVGEQWQPIQVADTPHSPLKVTASLSHRHPKTNEFLELLNEHELVAIGSGLKFCHVAKGAVDAYVRFQGTMEWDTAAPQAIVESAGGVIDWEDPHHTYGRNERRNTGFICRPKGLELSTMDQIRSA